MINWQARLCSWRACGRKSLAALAVHSRRSSRPRLSGCADGVARLLATARPVVGFVVAVAGALALARFGEAPQDTPEPV